MGKISVVGIGPGSLDDMTYRARRTIEEATTVVGYKRYVELIAELVDGKKVLDTGMTQEIDRCRAALKEASEGETVVVISSGDAGIYGMAGLVLELLVKMDEAERPEFGGVIPGVSAMSAAAGLLGAPLMHDFVASRICSRRGRSFRSAQSSRQRATLSRRFTIRAAISAWGRSRQYKRSSCATVQPRLLLAL